MARLSGKNFAVCDTVVEIETLPPSIPFALCAEDGFLSMYRYREGQWRKYPDIGTAAFLNTPISMSNLSTPVKATIDGITAAGPTSAAFHPASDFALVNDLRLSDARTPLSHVHAYADLTSKPTLGSAAALSSSAFATAIQGTKADTALQSESDPIASAALTAHAVSVHAHGRLSASLVSNVSVTNIEKAVVSLAIPANSLRAGSSFHFRAFGNFAMSLNLASISKAQIRMGPTSLLGALGATVTVNNAKGLSGTAPFMIEGDCTVKSVGVVGQLSGRLCMWGAIVAPFNDDISVPLTAQINTTINNVLELTYFSTNAAANAVFDVAFIEGG